jgi:hypothetical protein
MMGSMMRRAMLGDGSTLNLDFTTMTATADLTARGLTFTRGSTGTRINASGFVETMSNNVARFDHDPTTLAPRGLLVEGTATNLLNWSESFATSGGTNNNWADTSITRTTGQADPANGTTAIRFTASAGNATVISSAAIGTSAERTFSVWLRRVTGTGNIQYTQNNGTNWTTQAITATWTRYTFTHTVDHRVGIRIVTSGDAIEMWGAQLETGSGASSYIPTGASQATRNADNCSIHDTTTSGNLSWFKTATQGTFYVEAFKRTAGTTFAAAIIGTRANSGQDFILYQAVGNNWLSLNWGASEYVTNYSTLSSPFLIKAAVAFSPRTGTPTVADSLVSINGANSALNTTPNVALPFSSDLFCVGARGSANGTVPTQNYAEVAIRRIKFFPTAMTAAQLNAMTTL